MSADAGGTAPSPAAAGVGAFAAYSHLARTRITEYFAARQREALVIGVFGEWGSGKSTLLADIAEAFRNEPPAEGDVAEVVLRVDFNAWRYEREEHLLVPLLFTVETTLKEYVASVEAARPVVEPPPRRWWSRGGSSEPRESTTAWLRRRAALLGNCVVALSHAVKFTVGVPEVAGAEIDLAAAFEASRAMAEREDERTRRAVPMRPAWQSLYYDLHRELKKVTRGDAHGAQKLNVVFFIDDLDRCLPEKAVEMLEAIKLFLDIEGCAFVLAVDDEVVERGIAHRYRDYLGVGDRSADSVAYSLKPERFREFRSQFTGGGLSGSAPITGHEYLEKIIQLPIRLPRFSRVQARQLLLDTARRLNSPDLFAASAAHPGREANEWLLDLFLTAAPLSPRKLIRAVELLAFVLRLARQYERVDALHPYTLAQLVLLQCFAPQMFRDLARRRAAAWKRFGERIEEADASRVAIGSPSFLTWWEGRIRDDKAHTDPGIVKRAEVIEEPFVVQVRQTIGFRSGFDPRDLFLVGYAVDDDLAPYFNLIAERPVTPAVAPPPVQQAAAVPPISSQRAPKPPPQPASLPSESAVVSVQAPPASLIAGGAVQAEIKPPSPLPSGSTATPVHAGPVTSSTSTPRPTQPLTASPRQPTTFVDLLMAPDTATRIGAVRDEPALTGRVLDSRTVGLLLERVKTSPEIVTAAWLSTVGNILGDGDLNYVLRTSDLAARLVTKKSFASNDELGRILEWYCQRMRPWHVDDRRPLALEDIGLPGELEVHSQEWSYRYLRGIRNESVTPEEPLAIWPAYASSVEADVRAVVEIAPGRIAMATSEGEVGLWSRSLRGMWQMDAKLASCGPADVQVAALGAFDVVTHVKGQGLSVWHRFPEGWRWNHRSDPLNATHLTALSVDAFAMCPSNLTVRLSVDAGDRQGSHWQFHDWQSLDPITALVRISNRRVLIVGSRLRVLELHSGGITQVTESGTERFVHGVRAGEVLLLMTHGGNVLTYTLRASTLTPGPSLATTLTSIVEARSNGFLALLLALDGSCELWNCEDANQPQRLGGGSIGASPHAGICLLRDGSVVVSTPTNVQRFAMNYSTGKLEFAETVVSVEPTATTIVSASAEGMTLARGSTVFSIGDRVLPMCETAPSGLHAVTSGAAAGTNGVALIGRSKAVSIVVRGRSIITPLDEEPRFIASFGDAVAVGLRDQLVFLSEQNNSWAIERVEDQFGNLQNLTSDGHETGLAWAEDGRVQLVRRNGKYDLNEHRAWPVTTGVHSIVAVPPHRLQGIERPASSRFLVCSRKAVILFSVNTAGIRQGSEIPLALDQGDEGRFAMPIGSDQVLVLTRKGHVMTTAFGPPGTAVGWEAMLHGGIKSAAMIPDGSGVVARAADDAVYRLTVDANNLLRTRRYLLQPPILVQQEMNAFESISASRLVWTDTGTGGIVAHPAPDWSRLDVNQAALRLAAWIRGNDRLAELFERPEEFTSAYDGRLLRIRGAEELE